MDTSGRTIDVRRSARRKRTISARLEGETLVVLAPAHVSQAELDQAVAELGAKIDARREARTGQRSDHALLARANELSQAHLDGRAIPAEVRWVTNQNQRWGSCTPSTGVIRITHRLQSAPDYVLDYVLLHELAHLLESGHGPAFKAWERRAPQYERARGFLEGAAWQP